MTSFLINAHWIDIPVERIYQKLFALGLKSWGDKTLYIDGRARHYLFGDDYAYPYSLPGNVIKTLSTKLNEANYMTWYRDRNRQAVEYFEAQRQALNQAQEYWAAVGDIDLPKPEILPVDGLSEGQEYVAIIGLFHLIGTENGNNHHLFIDLIDENENRIYDHTPPLWLYYGWEGMSTEEANSISPVRIDKPPNEPGANIGIIWPQIIYGFHINNIATDRFRGVHIRYENDGDGNDRGHHSHYIVLQKRIYEAGTIPDPDPDPDPGPDPDPTGKVGEIKITLEQGYRAELTNDEDGEVVIDILKSS